MYLLTVYWFLNLTSSFWHILMMAPSMEVVGSLFVVFVLTKHPPNSFGFHLEAHWTKQLALAGITTLPIVSLTCLIWTTPKHLSLGGLMWMIQRHQ